MDILGGTEVKSVQKPVELLLSVGAAGEALVHSPADIAVPGCENGADVVAHKDPNCHG